MAKGIWVKVKNHKKFKGRSDIKFPQWFACSNRLLEDPDFYDFDFAEIAVWLYILSKASIEKSETVFIHFQEADRKCRLTKKIILSAIEKLKEKQIDILLEHDTDAIRTESVQNPYATGEGIEGNRIEGEGIEPDPPPEADGSLTPKKLLNLWNENSGSLSKAEKLTDLRSKAANARIKSYPDQTFWIQSIQKARDIFEGVPSSEWRFSFDNLINDSKLTKLIEGGYDFIRNKSSPNKTFAQKRSDANAELYQLAQSGGFDEYEK